MFPHRVDEAQRRLDPEVTVENAFEWFASEDCELLGMEDEIAPIPPAPVQQPSAPPRTSVAPVPASLSLTPSVASSGRPTGLDPRTIPGGLLASDWPMPNAPTFETLAVEPKNEGVDLAAPEVKVSAAIALLVAWMVALTMAGVAFLSEGPRLLPAMKSAITPPASPPPPVVQTHRTEDINLPSPQSTRAKKSR